MKDTMNTMNTKNAVASIETFNFLQSYEDKMDFLSAIRHEIGLTKPVVVTYDDVEPVGNKYIVDEYTMGTI